MPNRTRLIIAAICLIYVAARVWRLADSCLWFDEIFSVHAAEHEWGTMLSFIAKDLIHPPLFYACLKLWIGIGGESVFWLRLLPVAFSALALFPFVRLCRELKLRTSVIFLSLFLLAVNGALIKYTQTLRMYSMLMFLGLVSMWLFSRYFNRGKSWVPLVIANVLLVYTHYFGWLIIGTEVLAILWFQRIKWRRALVMFAVCAAAFLPWAIAVIEAARGGSSLAQNIAWQKRPGLREMITFVTDLIEPFYFQASNAEPISIFFISTPMILVGATAIAMYAMEWKTEERKHAIYLLLLFFGVPITVAFIASWLMPHSVWGTRHLIIVLPPAMILISHAITNVGPKPLRAILAGMVVLLSLFAFVHDLRREMPQHVWCAWNDVAADIKARSANEPTKIYAFENLVAYHLLFALRDSDQVKVGVLKGLDVRTADETYFLPRGFDAVETVRLDEVSEDSIWLAFRTSEPGEYDRLIEMFALRGYEDCSGGSSNHGRFETTTVFSSRLNRRPAGCQ